MTPFSDFDSMDWVDNYDSVVESDSGLFFRYSDILQAVSEVACPSPGLKVLDIGAGTGNLSYLCLARGASVVGLDPSERMLSQARARARSLSANRVERGGVGSEAQAHRSGVEFHVASDPFLKIPYPDSAFDAVVSTYAFHHIPHELQPESVREMVRVLRTGGVWAMGDVMFENAVAEAEARRTYEWLDGDEYYSRIDSLRSAFSQSGMVLHARQFTPVSWVLWASEAAWGRKPQ